MKINLKLYSAGDVDAACLLLQLHCSSCGLDALLRGDSSIFFTEGRSVRRQSAPHSHYAERQIDIQRRSPFLLTQRRIIAVRSSSGKFRGSLLRENAVISVYGRTGGGGMKDAAGGKRDAALGRKRRTAGVRMLNYGFSWRDGEPLPECAPIGRER